MGNIIHVISTRLDSTGRSLIKYLRYGSSDVQESLEVSPYGVDSNPIVGMVALYSKTGEIGKPVIVGYVNKNKLAEIGEYRAFSTDDKGNLKTYVHLKNDGIMLLGGDEDNAVKFSELKKGYDELKKDHNELVSKWNAFVLSYVPGSPSTIGLPPTLAGQNVVASVASIDKSKNEKIKTN